MADASAACDGVQGNIKIPVTCRTDYVDGVPSMIVGFGRFEEAEEWLGPFAKHIGGPFCDAANRNGREARVYMTVGTGSDQRVRRWSCELAKWGDWFSPAEDTRTPAQPQTIADAIRSCNNVQENRAVPVTCSTEFVDGVQAMIVGFPTASEAEKYLRLMADQVAGPFCDAANRVNRRAALFITLANSQARLFDCEQQQWGEWFELPREPNSGEHRSRS